jgi:hypothetical protein
MKLNGTIVTKLSNGSIVPAARHRCERRALAMQMPSKRAAQS